MTNAKEHQTSDISPEDITKWREFQLLNMSPVVYYSREDEAQNWEG